ncbi:MAG: GNAT family N-acetyltransferase [Defluviitaleaceae bacterium]|nr:GNAT family N-acetyltransferase [Defluviitaleaceae bacterium]
MDNLVFSPASREDIPAVADVYRSLYNFPGGTWSEHYPNIETAEEDFANGWLYTLKKDGEIIAVASAGLFNDLSELHIDWKPKNPCELARIGVVPKMHRKGVGETMLRHISEAARSNGFDGMRFLVSRHNGAALAMYDKNGFERCGEAFLFDLEWYCYQKKFEE